LVVDEYGRREECDDWRIDAAGIAASHSDHRLQLLATLTMR
jgi:hypothetical protein